MNRRKAHILLASVLILTSLLIQPIEVSGQCMTTGTPNMTTFGSTMVITKYLTTTRMCTGTVSMALACYPSLAEVKTLTFLVASAVSASMNVECGWACGTCSVTTDGSTDGLPVELMGFGFEDDE